MKCQKNKFTYNYKPGNHLSSSGKKKVKVDGSGSGWEEINGKIESSIDIDSFSFCAVCIPFLFSYFYDSHTSRLGLNVHPTMDLFSLHQYIYFLIVALARMLVKENLFFSFNAQTYTSQKTATKKYCPSSSLWFSPFCFPLFSFLQGNIFHVMSMAEYLFSILRA